MANLRAREVALRAIGTGLVLAFVAGCPAGEPEPEPKPKMEEDSRNGTVRQALNDTDNAIRMWATDHGERFPAAKAWYKDISANNYLANNEMYPVKYCDERQASSLLVKDVPGLVGAAAAAKGTPLTPMLTVLGPGPQPDPARIDRPLMAGAILYDHDPATNTYVLYGIGKTVEGNLDVVGSRTNAPEPPAPTGPGPG